MVSGMTGVLSHLGHEPPITSRDRNTPRWRAICMIGQPHQSAAAASGIIEWPDCQPNGAPPRGEAQGLRFKHLAKGSELERACRWWGLVGHFLRSHIVFAAAVPSGGLHKKEAARCHPAKQRKELCPALDQGK